MVMDALGAILEELGKALNMEQPLRPDANNSCLLKFKDDIRVQIELDKTRQYIIIGTEIGSIPPGRYRETVFTEAMKTNALPGSRYGVFAYSKQSDNLVLFEMIPLRNTSGTKIAEFLASFIPKAKNWKNMLTKGEIPVATTAGSQSSGLFGLKP